MPSIKFFNDNARQLELLNNFLNNLNPRLQLEIESNSSLNLLEVTLCTNNENNQLQIGNLQLQTLPFI